VTQLAPVIAANERVYDVTYHWSDRSRAVANEYDYVRRAEELTAPVLLVIGGRTTSPLPNRPPRCTRNWGRSVPNS